MRIILLISALLAAVACAAPTEGLPPVSLDAPDVLPTPTATLTPKPINLTLAQAAETRRQVINAWRFDESSCSRACPTCRGWGSRLTKRTCQ